jgi:translocation protein SEC62
VKRAIRALRSPEYAKAALKPKSLLPPVTDAVSAESAFKLLPISLLALRVSKADPHEGHSHAKVPPQKSRTKGLWTVRIEQHQETDPMMHYVWLYEGPQWKQKAMAAGALVAIMAVVMFPLWPIMLRQGVWYLSVGMMGLLGLFFAMSIFRLILFCVTVFVIPPGLWLFPNLFEDVGFFDSFKPVWGWQEVLSMLFSR